MKLCIPFTATSFSSSATKKTLRISGETNWRWRSQCDPYQVEHVRLFAAIRSGEPLNNGDYLARSTTIAVMGQLSCYTGKGVSWEQVNQADFCDAPRPEDCHDGMEAPTNLGTDNSSVSWCSRDADRIVGTCCFYYHDLTTRSANGSTSRCATSSR